MSKGIGGLDQLLGKLHKAKQALDQELGRALLRGGLVIAREAQRNVTGGGSSTTQLNVRTGRLRSSISAVMVGRYAVKVGTNVVYAPIHEFGGRTPPHDIAPRRRKALAFMRGGEMVIVRRVHHPGSRIPARPYMRPALEKKRPEVLMIIRAVYAGPLRIGGRLA